MIPMIMNREVFYLVSVIVAFIMGACFTYLRLRRGRQ